MAATVASVVGNKVFGDQRVSVVKVTGDSSYPTGGYPITPAQLGFADTVNFGDVGVVTPGASVTSAYFNPATQKLQLFTITAEVASATNVSAVVAQLIAFGY